MKRLKIVFTLTLFGLLALANCNNEPVTTPSDTEYLVFGQAFGECLGNDCSRIYKLDNQALFEDSKKGYPTRDDFYKGEYFLLSDDKFNKVRELPDYFPEQLWAESDTVFGCPDCLDQGMIYVEFKHNDRHGFWILDNNKESNPEYLREFVQAIQDKIKLINEP